MRDLIDNNMIEDAEEEVEDCLGTFECECVGCTHLVHSTTAPERKLIWIKLQLPCPTCASIEG